MCGLSATREDTRVLHPAPQRLKRDDGVSRDAGSPYGYWQQEPGEQAHDQAPPSQALRQPVVRMDAATHEEAGNIGQELQRVPDTL